MNRDKARRRVLKRIKKQARAHHKKTQLDDSLDCGMMMQDHIQGTDREGHRDEYQRCVRRLRRIDPDFPKEEASNG